MAVLYSSGFHVTSEQWEEHCAEQSQAVLLKKLHDNIELRIQDGKHCAVSYWIDGVMASLAIIHDRAINDREYQDLLFIASDPDKRQKGYATALLWEIFWAFDKPLLVGGAISPEGQKLVFSFMKALASRETDEPKMIDVYTGEVHAFDQKKYLRRPGLSLVLECFALEACKMPTAKHPYWLHQPNLFEGQP